MNQEKKIFQGVKIPAFLFVSGSHLVVLRALSWLCAQGSLLPCLGGPHRMLKSKARAWPTVLSFQPQDFCFYLEWMAGVEGFEKRDRM